MLAAMTNSSAHRGSSLISLLLAACIVLVVAALFLRPSRALLQPGATLGADTALTASQDIPAVSRPEQALDQAKKAVEISREHRVRMAEEQFRFSEGRDPESQRELYERGYISESDLDP